jgi:hypothetical protein
VLAAPATGRFLLRGNQKRCHMAVLYPCQKRICSSVSS